MRSRGKAGLLALAFTGATWAASPPDAPPGVGAVRVLHQGTRHDALFGLDFEGQQGTAVGGFGAVMSSADGGHTWTTTALPTKGLALLGVARRAGRCITVGQAGLVFRAADCRAWQASDSGTPARLLGVGLNRNGVAYAVGAFGTVLRSADAGGTWATVPIDWKAITPDGAEPHLYGVHVADDGTVTMVGEFELVLRADAGATAWRVLNKGEHSLFGLTVSEDGQWYAAGQGGRVLHSADAGVTWKPLPTGSQAVLSRVAVSRQGQLLVGGLNTLLRSHDGGRSWQPAASRLPANAWFQAVAAVPGEGAARAVAAGAGGLLLDVEF